MNGSAATAAVAHCCTPIDRTFFSQTIHPRAYYFERDDNDLSGQRTANGARVLIDVWLSRQNARAAARHPNQFFPRDAPLPPPRLFRPFFKCRIVNKRLSAGFVTRQSVRTDWRVTRCARARVFCGVTYRRILWVANGCCAMASIEWCIKYTTTEFYKINMIFWMNIYYFNLANFFE